MFEFSVLRKYLIPRKRHLSVSLIGMMSLFVISSVVWLILVFLSVTSGIEKNWLEKLTSFNALIQVQPNDRYYRSYYHLIDSYSFHSSYSPKSIREKLHCASYDPYDPTIDEALPPLFPEKENKDLIKQAFSQMELLKNRFPSLQVQDFEVAPSLLKIKLFRSTPGFEHRFFSQNFITQAAYVSNLGENHNKLGHLITPPSLDDLNHLLSKCDCVVDHLLSDTDTSIRFSSSSEFFESLIKHGHIEEVKLHPSFVVKGTIFKEKSYFYGLLIDNEIFIHMDPSLANSRYFSIHKNEIKAMTQDNQTLSLPLSTRIHFPEKMTFTPLGAHAGSLFALSHQSPHARMQITTKAQNLIIKKAHPTFSFDSPPSIEPLWAYLVNGIVHIPKLGEDYFGIILPKNFQEGRVLIGDVGHLSYGSFSLSSSVEQRQSIQVVGFYDPGIMAVGARSILAPYELVHLLSSSSYSQISDPFLVNGIQLWFDDIKQTGQIKKELLSLFKSEGLDPYFDILAYDEYPFSKDLIQQFQSDKYLFMLIGFIILAVACSNIIALLVMLVKDKKKEIGIMQAMGASKKSIASIFGLVGGLLGLLSCMIGTLVAFITLKNIDSIVSLLSSLQGRDAFNPIFYGYHLPSAISYDALRFLFILTPILSIIAALIPALIAMRLSPTEILKSEN